MTPGSPEVASATYDDGSGEISVFGTEDLTLVDPSVTPWTVRFDGVPQAVSTVSQGSNFVIVTTAIGSPAEVRLDYAGGPYVVGTGSGLPLVAVSDFPVSVA